VFAIPRDRLADVEPWFLPELPGPLVYQHVRRSGVGRVLVDRWPDPRLILAEAGGGNYALRGDSQLLDESAVLDVAGFVEAPPSFEPPLRLLDPDLGSWDRVIFLLAESGPPASTDPRVRRVTSADAPAMSRMHPELAWIAETWGGAAALAATGVAWAAFAAGTPIAVALPFYLGSQFEDIGVVTAPECRRQGLARSSAAAVISDIRERGHTPTWTTSPDNTSSLAVAESLGFRQERTDGLWAFRAQIPTG